MEKREEMEMQLWEYIDGLCNESDRQRISMLINNDAIWQQAHDELKAVHVAIATQLPTEQPSLRFSKNVMEAVAAAQVAPSARNYINRSIIRGIAAFFIIMIVSMLVIAFATADWNPGGNEAVLQWQKGSDAFSGVLTTRAFNIVIAVYVVLSLVLVDKLMHKRRQEHR
jgi:hypothetical protein